MEIDWETYFVESTNTSSVPTYYSPFRHISSHPSGNRNVFLRAVRISSVDGRGDRIRVNNRPSGPMSGPSINGRQLLATSTSSVSLQTHSLSPTPIHHLADGPLQIKSSDNSLNFTQGIHIGSYIPFHHIPLISSIFKCRQI